MLNPLFPQRVDNAYRGYTLALWLFALVVLLNVLINTMSIFNGYSVTRSADGVPLDTFAPAAARTVVSVVALLGLSNLMVCLLGVLVLVRYRTLIPMMFALLLLEYLGRRLILHFLPIPRTGTPPGSAVNLALLAVMIAGLALSLLGRGDSRARD
jgi:putative exporter of polyketide antibiotics